MAGRQVQVVADGYGTLLVQDRCMNTQRLGQPGHYSQETRDPPAVSH